MRRYERGESSKKSNQSDDNDRPLKKAKYVWQLKGKYHLKDQYNKINDEQNEIEEQQENLEKSEKRECNNCITNLIAHSNNLLREDDEDEEIPVSMVRPPRENHDDYLQKWQARHVAKSFIDNTINTILEQWKLAPTEANDGYVDENCDNGQVEDEGIMMAIQSHGLQSGLQPHSLNANPDNLQFNSNFNSDVQSKLHSDGLNSLESQEQMQELQQISDYQEESTENYQNKQFECDDGKENLIETDQVEFLSTAVAMAIQNKGLSSYSYG